MDQHDFRLRKAEFRDRNYSRDNYDAPREDTDLEAQVIATETQFVPGGTPSFRWE